MPWFGAKTYCCPLVQDVFEIELLKNLEILKLATIFTKIKPPVFTFFRFFYYIFPNIKRIFLQKLFCRFCWGQRRGIALTIPSTFVSKWRMYWYWTILMFYYICLYIILSFFILLLLYCLCFRQSGQTETRNAADDEDSFTKQQFDIIQQIMHHTQQQIASSSSTTAAAAKTPNPKNPSNTKNWNAQQVRTLCLYRIVVAKNTYRKWKKNNNKRKFDGSTWDEKSQRRCRNILKTGWDGQKCPSFRNRPCMRGYLRVVDDTKAV